MNMPKPLTHPMLDMGSPILLHSSREYECSFNSTEQCGYQQGYWRFWWETPDFPMAPVSLMLYFCDRYEADHRYGLPTVAFFLAPIILYALGRCFFPFMPKGWSRARTIQRLIAAQRYLLYRKFRLDLLDWNSAPLGVLLLGAIGTVFFLCMTLGPRPYYWPNTQDLSFGSSPPLATRTAWLSLACLPFIFATAGKSNFITLATGVSHERLQVFHRWIAYAFFVLALVHTFPFIVYHIWLGDMVAQWKGSVLYWTGVVALLAQAWLTCASMSPLRNRHYEFFKSSYFFAALVFTLILFIHCDYTLTSWDYFIATGCLFSLSWLHRQVRVFFGHGMHTATVCVVSNGFVRISVPTKATWGAGQHFFVRFVSIETQFWTAHPFSACSLPEPKLVEESELVFYVRPQGGLTRRLAKYAEKSQKTKMRIFLDGPYGGIDTRTMNGCQRLIVIAGGSGAGWCLPFITAFLRKWSLDPNNGSSMRVILTSRDTATQQWFESAIADLLASMSLHTKALPELILELHYTGTTDDVAVSNTSRRLQHNLEDPEKALKVRSDSQSTSEVLRDKISTKVNCFGPRPHLQSIIAEEARAQTNALGVYLCGPHSMHNDLSNAVAQQQLVILKEGAEQPKEDAAHTTADHSSTLYYVL